jgi:hypothetical protein
LFGQLHPDNLERASASSRSTSRRRKHRKIAHVLRRRVVLLAFCAATTPSAPLSGQTPDWFGTWRLNVEKSVYDAGPPPYRRATMAVESRPGGLVRFAYDFVFPRGGVQHLEWIGRFDGKDYMVQGADEYITYAHRLTGERTSEITAKLDTRVTAVATVTLSPDGRTLSSTTRGRNARGQDVVSVTVYDKIH